MTELKQIRSLVIEIDKRIGFKSENDKLLWYDGDITMITICYHNRAEIPQIINFSGLVESPLGTIVVGDIFASTMIDGLTLDDIGYIADIYEEQINNAMIEEQDFLRIDESNFNNKKEALS